MLTRAHPHEPLREREITMMMAHFSYGLTSAQVICQQRKEYGHVLTVISYHFKKQLKLCCEQ